MSIVITTKRWNDPRGTSDGLRVLVCRYRPRGLSRRDETWGEWRSELGPSRLLHADFYGKHGPPIGWMEFRRRYLKEMKEQEASINQLAGLAASGQSITLLCSSACVDAAKCHRTLLRGLIEKRVRGLDNEKN